MTVRGNAELRSGAGGTGLHDGDGGLVAAARRYKGGEGRGSKLTDCRYQLEPDNTTTYV